MVLIFFYHFCLFYMCLWVISLSYFGDRQYKLSSVAIEAVKFGFGFVLREIMTKDLLEIHPDELGFTIEWMKHSFCSMRFVNNSDQYVAYKVKTTSPRKYSVRPNVGIVKPNSEYEAIVTMVAPRIAQLDLVCKDKFLVQATVVPYGTTDAEIRPEMFVKEEGKYIEEKKLRVNLISPPLTPEISTISSPIKENPDSDLKLVNEDVVETKMLNLDDVAEKDHVLQHTEDVKDSKLEADSKPNGKLDEEVPEKDVVLQHAEDVKGLKLEADEKLNEDVAENGIVLQHAEDAKDSKFKADDKLNEEKDVVLRHAEDVKDSKLEADSKLYEDDAKNDILLQRAEYVKDSKLEADNKLYEEVAEKDIVLQRAEDVKDLKLEADSRLNEEAKSVDCEEVTEKVIVLRLKEELKDAKLENDIKEMKLKLSGLESNLNEIEVTISKLTEERRLSRQEKETFSLLLVFLVSIISVLLGYILHQ